MTTMSRFQNPLEYASRQIADVQCENAQWLDDHREATKLHILETLIGKANLVIKMAFDLDVEIHLAYCNELEFDGKVDQDLAALFRSTAEIAGFLSEKAVWFEEQGYSISGLAELRDRQDEIIALLNPSDLANSDEEAAAILAEQNGETEDWPSEE